MKIAISQYRDDTSYWPTEANLTSAHRVRPFSLSIYIGPPSWRRGRSCFCCNFRKNKVRMLLCGNIIKIFVMLLIAMEICQYISIGDQDPSLPAGERDGYSCGQGGVPCPILRGGGGGGGVGFFDQNFRNVIRCRGTLATPSTPKRNQTKQQSTSGG